MANFVLVHGAWSSGWDWSEVAEVLRQAGHAVHAPTLTGLGERGHTTGRKEPVGLDLHVQDVVALLEWHELGEVIMVGHSYGGMVITGAAARVPARIRTLVYLDAFVPADGQSLADLGTPDRRAHLEAAAAHDGGRVPPLVRPARERSSERTQAYAHRLRPMALECFTQPARLTGEEAKIPNRTYVYATADAPTSRIRFYEALRNDPAWRIRTIGTGHLVMIDDPAALSRMLLDEVPR